MVQIIFFFLLTLLLRCQIKVNPRAPLPLQPWLDNCEQKSSSLLQYKSGGARLFCWVQLTPKLIGESEIPGAWGFCSMTASLVVFPPAAGRRLSKSHILRCRLMWTRGRSLVTIHFCLSQIDTLTGRDFLNCICTVNLRWMRDVGSNESH